MSDIATIGLRVDSSQVKEAKTALDAFAIAGAGAAKGAIGLEAAAARARDEMGRFVKTTNSGLSSALDKVTKQTGLARHEMINFGRQVQDVGVSLASGQNPFMVAIQQGTQIADIFASSEGSVRGFARQVASVITPMRAFVGVTAAVGLAAYAANAYWKSTATALDDVSRATGTTIQQFRGLSNAAEVKGIANFDEASQRFAANLYDANNNMGRLADLFRVNNVRAGDFVNSLAKVADLIRNASSDQQRLQILQQAGLPATMQWVRFMSQGGDAIKRAAQEAQGFGSRADSDMIKKAREFDEAWNRGWLRFREYSFDAINSAKGWLDTFLERAEKFRQGGGIAGALVRNLPTGYQAPGGGGLDTGRSEPFTNRSALTLDSVHGAMGYRPNPTVDDQVVRNNLANEARRLSMLGQTLSASQQVRQVEIQITQARLDGVRITEREAAALKDLAAQQALGISQIRAGIDAYRIETDTTGMSLGQATAYAAAQNAIADARRRGMALTPENIAWIEREASALGEAAKRADDMRWGYENLVRGPLQSFRSELQNGAGFFDALKKSGISALDAISTKLIDMAAQNLWQSAFPSGGGTSLLSLLGFNSTGVGLHNPGGFSAAFPAPIAHSGRGPGDAIRNVRYVHPAHFNDAPRFHSGIGAGEMAAIIRKDESVLTPGQMKQLTPVSNRNAAPTFNFQIDARGAQQGVGKEIAETLKAFVDSPAFDARVINTYRNAHKQGRI